MDYKKLYHQIVGLEDAYDNLPQGTSGNAGRKELRLELLELSDKFYNSIDDSLKNLYGDEEKIEYFSKCFSKCYIIDRRFRATR